MEFLSLNSISLIFIFLSFFIGAVFDSSSRWFVSLEKYKLFRKTIKILKQKTVDSAKAAEDDQFNKKILWSPLDNLRYVLFGSGVSSILMKYFLLYSMSINILNIWILPFFFLFFGFSVLYYSIYVYLYFKRKNNDS